MSTMNIERFLDRAINLLYIINIFLNQITMDFIFNKLNVKKPPEFVSPNVSSKYVNCPTKKNNANKNDF